MLFLSGTLAIVFVTLFFILFISVDRSNGNVHIFHHGGFNRYCKGTFYRTTNIPLHLALSIYSINQLV